MLDTSALVLAGIEGICTRQAELTFAMARHTIVDLAAVFNRPPKKYENDRLGDEGFTRLRSMLEAAGLKLTDDREAERRLQRLRESYEPHVYALARYFRLAVPPWIPEPGKLADWEISLWEQTTPLNGDVIHKEWKNHHFR